MNVLRKGQGKLDRAILEAGMPAEAMLPRHFAPDEALSNPPPRLPGQARPAS